MCGWGVCRKFANYLTSNFLLYIFLHNSNIFITFVVQNDNNHKYNNPPKSKFMITKHLQGGQPTSASSVNAMCGACRHSCNPFRNDSLSFFLRHGKARRRNQSVQQNGERRAIIALCAILITTKRNRR